MIGMGAGQGDNCPFIFNFDAATFKAGDRVSYRVPEDFGDMAFVGELVAVADDHVLLRHCGHSAADSSDIMRGTRESRPIVSLTARVDV
jgi:hypothetical protein